MRMKQVLTVGVLAMSSTIAMAGRVQQAPVTVTVNADGSGNAAGSMATARASASDVEFIGCGVRATDNSAGSANVWAFCQATDAAGIQAYCFTYNRELLDIIKNVADYSFVTFTWNADTTCRFIGVSTQSFYIP
jgi:hypothetical protein